MSNSMTLQRAYELARSGRYGSLTHLEKTLESERHTSVRDKLAGAKIRSELKRLIKEARTVSPAQE